MTCHTKINHIQTLKTGYIEFDRLESYADAIHAAIVSPAVAMAAVAAHLHNAYRQVITSHREFYIARNSI